MPKLSAKSESILETVDERIQAILAIAIENGPDFTVISGRRTPEEQREKVRRGYSKTM